MPALVLDCSVTFAWLLADEQPAVASQILDQVAEKGAVAPGLWPPIEIDDETAGRAWREALALAETYHLTVYDAAYLELALRRSLPLATFDAALRSAAATAGVPLLA